jgi:putative transposase
LRQLSFMNADRTLQVTSGSRSGSHSRDEAANHVGFRSHCGSLRELKGHELETKVPIDVVEDRLRRRITSLACQYGRYGYRPITMLLRAEGWRVNHKRVARIWCEEGLKAPQKQPGRRRLWPNRSSCVRLRGVRPNHLWSHDFVLDRTSDGRVIRMLTVIDEFTRESLRIRGARKITAIDVPEQLADLFIIHRTPDHFRSDNGPEFVATIVRSWLGRLGVQTPFIERGSPWENRYIESFNGMLRDGLLNGEIFDTIMEARVVTEAWRKHYNTIRPHCSLGHGAPAPAAYVPPQVANT